MTAASPQSATPLTNVDVNFNCDYDSAADSSPSPPIDTSKLRCYVMRTRKTLISRKKLATIAEKYRAKYSKPISYKRHCKSPVVYRIFATDGQVLDACNMHFNVYFEKHEIAAEMVMRLSEDEDDYNCHGKDDPKSRKRKRK